MFVLICYKDNTMTNYVIIESNKDFDYLEKRLHGIRKEFSNKEIKPIMRIIRIG